jgi:hypothetical protein
MNSQLSPANGTMMIFADEANGFMSGFGITPDNKPNNNANAAMLRSLLSGRSGDEVYKTASELKFTPGLLAT